MIGAPRCSGFGPVAWLLSLPIRLYRLVLSPLLPAACRFHPSCSRYALEALQLHGAIGGSFLALGRLCRCHPFHEGGHDPVPPRRDDRAGAAVAAAPENPVGGR